MDGRHCAVRMLMASKLGAHIRVLCGLATQSGREGKHHENAQNCAMCDSSKSQIVLLLSLHKWASAGTI